MSKSDCERYVKNYSLPDNYFCMKKGIEVGNSIKLPSEYNPMDDTFQESEFKASPYLCFKKGFAIGKKNQYEKNKFKIKENFTVRADPLEQYFSSDDADQTESVMLFIAIVIGLITVGLFIAFEIYWLWAIIVGIVSSSLFLYFCNCQS